MVSSMQTLVLSPLEWQNGPGLIRAIGQQSRVLAHSTHFLKRTVQCYFLCVPEKNIKEHSDALFVYSNYSRLLTELLRASGKATGVVRADSAQIPENPSQSSSL